MRVHFEVHAVGEALQQQATEAPVHDREVLRLSLDLDHRAINFRQELSGGRDRTRAIPLERLGDLGLRETSNDDATHSGQSAAQFVPKRLPGNAGLRVRIGLGLTAR